MGRPFPRRILALDRTSGGDIYVKVMEAESKATIGIYATLSYCRGLELPCLLSTDNHTDRLSGIQWTELPQTFQDAIRYCLELEVFYLWIDALCIIQDDPEDWQIQSAMMASIYENSYITLAATTSDCVSSGCFQKKSTAYKERSLEVSGTGGHVSQIFIRQRISHWDVPSTSASKRDNPLLSRGWAFQERILSPRVLHFCKHELVWECGQETFCECGSISGAQNLKRQFALAARLQSEEETLKSEKHDGRSSLSQISSSQRVDLHCLQDSEAMSEAVNQWHNIVEQFSELELSREKDSLPALSGLAERMSPFLGNYLAGLWTRSFLWNLCWRVDMLVFGPQRPAEYRGPSWSWVSTKPKVAFWTEEELTPRLIVAEPNRRYTGHRRAASRFTSSAHDSRAQVLRNQRAPVLDIISCTVDIAGKNKYGEVSSTLLLVEGNLTSSKLRRHCEFYIPNSALRSRFGVRDGSASVPPSFEVDVECVGETAPESETEFRLPFFADHILDQDGGHRMDGSEVAFLLNVLPNIWLVLSKTSLKLSRDTCIFRRIGILKISHVGYGVEVMRGSQRTRVAII